MNSQQYDGIKVFSATRFNEREHLGEKVTSWIQDHPQFTPVKTLVRQSSDAEYHCLSVILFFASEKATGNA